MFASSSSVYGEAERYPTSEDAEPRPLSPYGITKLSAEHLARAYARSFGLDVVVLRYFNAFGPRQRPDMAFRASSTRFARGRPFELYGDGRQSRGFTYVLDVVEATIRAMEAAPQGALYNVGGGSEVTMLEAIELLERLSGRSLDVRFSPAVPGDQRRTRADTTRIEAELGWKPKTPFEQGLEAQWDWAADRVAAPMSERARVIELDAEEEVDLRSAWRRISARWWLPLVGLVVGAVLGVLVSVGGGETYRAETLLYLGQPFTALGGGQIQSLADEPADRQRDHPLRVGDASARPSTAACGVGQLRGNVSSQPIRRGGARRGNVSPLVEISVEAPAPAKARARGRLARRVR